MVGEDESKGGGNLMATWKTPKTNWTKTDKFNIEDFNRIKNNLVYLREKSVELTRYFEIEDMGSDMYDYASYWDVDTFNKIERNLEKINQSDYQEDYGAMQTFYENGAFIKYDELNRIESASLGIKEMLERHKQSLRRIPFVLGRYKEVRV